MKNQSGKNNPNYKDGNCHKLLIKIYYYLWKITKKQYFCNKFIDKVIKQVRKEETIIRQKEYDGYRKEVFEEEFEVEYKKLLVNDSKVKNLISVLAPYLGLPYPKIKVKISAKIGKIVIERIK